MENDQTSTGNATELQNLTEQLEQGVRGGKYSWREIQDAVMFKTREAAAHTDLYAHENPWKVVGLAAGLGFVLGLLLAPHSSE